MCVSCVCVNERQLEREREREREIKFMKKETPKKNVYINLKVSKVHLYYDSSAISVP